jgi:glutathione S-transferase
MLTIYGSPFSSPTNKVRFVANYLGLNYQFKPIDLAKGQHLQPDYLKINPFGRVPCIQHDDFNLSESNAIIRYLSDLQQSALYPLDLKRRAIVDQWIDYASQHIMMALSRIMFNTYLYSILKIEKDERALQDGYKYIKQYLPVVEQQLRNTNYIAGDHLTLADLCLLASLDTAEVLKVDLKGVPHVESWLKKLMNEQFYQAVHKSYRASFEPILKMQAVEA